MKEDLGSTPVYSMGVAERLTGLTGRQIRYWEQHGLLAPARTKGRQRMYSEADIVRIKEIRRLMADGMTLERVKTYYEFRESRRMSSLGDVGSARLPERGPRATSSLYGGSNRAEVERMIDRKRR
jgi:MerR family glutamine synthetase transcriptional repressor